MKTFELLHAHALYLRFSAIYGDKFVKTYHDDKFKNIWCQEWMEGLIGIDVNVIKSALDYCKLNLNWAPSIAEFRKICETFSGVPTIDETLQMAIRNDFSHPIVSLAYEKVGKWAMTHAKESDIEIKFKKAYVEALDEFRKDSASTWKQLTDFNEKRSLPALPPKIPTIQERKKFVENFKSWRERAEEEKSKAKKIDHPVYSKETITLKHKKFDQTLYNDRREYLMNLSENDAFTLTTDDKYDRRRFLNEKLASELLQENSNNSINDYYTEKKSKHTFTKKCFDYWMN